MKINGPLLKKSNAISIILLKRFADIEQAIKAAHLNQIRDYCNRELIATRSSRKEREDYPGDAAITETLSIKIRNIPGF